jgi:hypothetical protein
MRWLFSILLIAAVHRNCLLAASELRVAVAQPLVVPGDVDKNLERMSKLIVEAAKQDADVIVFF